MTHALDRTDKSVIYKKCVNHIYFAGFVWLKWRPWTSGERKLTYIGAQTQNIHTIAYKNI